MQVDQTTLTDLAIVNNNEAESLFHLFDTTQTTGGKFYLQELLLSPLKSIDSINDTQKTLQYLSQIKQSIPTNISNGTVMVMEKFYDTAIDTYPTHCNALNCFFYSIFSKADFSLSKYSLQHFIEFVKGVKKMRALLDESKSNIIKFWIEKIELHTNKIWINTLLEISDVKSISNKQILDVASNLRNHFKHDCFELIEIFCKIDAYLSIVNAINKYDFNFPNFIETEEPCIKANSIYHPLLSKAIAYNVELRREENFLFLTGANMAGKSTFIKAVGISIYLSHLGFPVPAKQLQLSYFDGLLSNINIVDNIFKNESYFFNEVKRIKSTIEKIGDNKKWLILIDELFKGTNIQDAMKCSLTVINGLQKKQNAVFILSTHLYEIGEDLKQHNNIQFKYFETSVINHELCFSYQLKDGISNDKLGYLILEREGVVSLLN
ncbi:MAG: DNA mismatch repair protein MutS [Bacteroidetes bacterium]|nr:DNA mismatch repair protein MutS [Bacteroidota bacterium]